MLLGRLELDTLSMRSVAREQKQYLEHTGFLVLVRDRFRIRRRELVRSYLCIGLFAFDDNSHISGIMYFRVAG